VNRERTIWRLLQLFGLACLIIVVLTHIAEAFHLFPSMGWGLPNSAGHYLDFVSAILGCILLPLGFLANVLTRRKNSTEALPLERPCTVNQFVHQRLGLLYLIKGQPLLRIEPPLTMSF